MILGNMKLIEILGRYFIEFYYRFDSKKRRGYSERAVHDCCVSTSIKIKESNGC